MKNLFLFLLILAHQFAYGQKEENNWYFGRYAAISFESGTARAKYDNPQNIYGNSASISDPATGQLLFYTDGTTVWNRLHLTMANGGGISANGNGDKIIVPVPGSATKYYLFFIGNIASLQYVMIDMSQNAGVGAVVQNERTVSANHTKQIAVVRHQYADAYWVIVHELNKSTFKAHYVDESGVSLQPVVSNTGLPAYGYGDMVASNQGHKLAVTHYTGNDYKAEVFDFDRVCGTVSRPVQLHKEPIWDYAYGIAFSPDDSKLYITYSYQLSQLVQYYGTDYSSSYFIASSPSNYNSMRPGPDNRIYMATHDGGIPGPRINAIMKPDVLATSCDFRETFIYLDDNRGFNRAAAFELPMFASGKRKTTPLKDSVFTVTGSCVGDTAKFFFNTANPYDSIHWKFGDNNTNESRLLNPVHVYRQGGRYEVLLSIFRCGKKFELKDTIRIDSFPVIDLPKDTIVCAKTITLLNGPAAEKYVWSTGAPTRSVLIKDTGTVLLAASNGNCSSTDSVHILNYPDLITLLGSEYFLCEDDKELVKLDAGEGFINYKWTPTEDTSQWIVVGNTGDFFVKVTDNHGCIGNDDTRVKRRCGVLLYFPNAFTPNHDGVNDFYRPSGLDVLEFDIKIYNRWGELVFGSNTINKGWDGLVNDKPAADGVYTYLAEYTGYRKKLKQTFYKKGTFTLLR